MPQFTACSMLELWCRWLRCLSRRRQRRRLACRSRRLVSWCRWPACWCRGSSYGTHVRAPGAAAAVWAWRSWCTRRSTPDHSSCKTQQDIVILGHVTTKLIILKTLCKYEFFFIIAVYQFDLLVIEGNKSSINHVWAKKEQFHSKIKHGECECVDTRSA